MGAANCAARDLAVELADVEEVVGEVDSCCQPCLSAAAAVAAAVVERAVEVAAMVEKAGPVAVAHWSPDFVLHAHSPEKRLQWLPERPVLVVTAADFGWASATEIVVKAGYSVELHLVPSSLARWFAPVAWPVGQPVASIATAAS